MLHSGGSVLATLLASKNPALKDIDLSVLVRGEDRARVLAEKGLHVHLFRDLDQTELLEDIASNYDGMHMRFLRKQMENKSNSPASRHPVCDWISYGLRGCLNPRPGKSSEEDRKADVLYSRTYPISQESRVHTETLI